MAKVVWTVQAWDELAEINYQLSNYSERYANFLVDKIMDAANNLEKLPRLGRVVPEVNLLNL
jgi:hypothetical protein